VHSTKIWCVVCAPDIEIRNKACPGDAALGIVGEERSWLVRWDLDGQKNDR
jgi:hypothetical protein